MDAIASGASSPNLSSNEVGGDPLQLVTLRGIYRKRASFYAPIQAWKRLGLHGLLLLFPLAGYSYTPRLQEGYF